MDRINALSCRPSADFINWVNKKSDLIGLFEFAINLEKKRNSFGDALEHFFSLEGEGHYLARSAPKVTAPEAIRSSSSERRRWLKTECCVGGEKIVGHKSFLHRTCTF